jgi:hypothetical protein
MFFAKEHILTRPFASTPTGPDNQMLSQAIYRGFRIGEVSCPTRYFPEASSINFRRSVYYAIGVLKTAIAFRLACMGFDRGTVFEGLRRRHMFEIWRCDGAPTDSP